MWKTSLKKCKIQILVMRKIKTRINKQQDFQLKSSSYKPLYIIAKTGNNYISVSTIQASTTLY